MLLNNRQDYLLNYFATKFSVQPNMFLDAVLNLLQIQIDGVGEKKESGLDKRIRSNVNLTKQNIKAQLSK